MIQSLQLTAALVSIYIFTLWTIYSIAQPQSIYSITQTKLYDTILSTSFILPTKGNDNNDTFLSTNAITNAIGSLIPIAEIKDAYDLLTQFVNPSILDAKIYYLAFITFLIQTGMGFLGIEFLRSEQNRKNALIKLKFAQKLYFNSLYPLIK